MSEHILDLASSRTTTVVDEYDAELRRPIVAFVDAVNRGDMDGALAQLAPDHLQHGRISSYRPEGVRTLFLTLRTVLPDLQLDIREMHVRGNQVVSRIVSTGVHTGSYLGKPPTGRPVAWESTDIADVSRGPVDSADLQELGIRIRENDYRGMRISRRSWDVFSDDSLWREIGFIPAIMC